ncbi:ABC transporter ATP-binding protein [Endothiovibrio diazotrophicus]
MSERRQPLLQVENLVVQFGREAPRSQVVHGVSLEVGVGEKLALVGESGSGKTVTAYSILRLHDPQQVHYADGAVRFAGRDLLRAPERELRAVRGREIAMIFQEPMSALNPVYPIGRQLIESLLLHEGLSAPAARRRMIELLDRTGIPEPHKRFDAFPHMLSGGQRQRVMIAMALACKPRLLIADEPTTALDVTVQAQILDLLDELQREFDLAVLLITHDLNMVRRFADRICVMERGRLVEQATVDELFANPRHDYTRRLLDAQPERMTREDVGVTGEPLMEGRGMRCLFPIRQGFLRRRVGEVRAVDGVDVAIRPGETVGLVGESGSGKSTLGMCLLRLQECDGEIRFDGRRLDTLRGRALRPLRRDFQVVFQDPFSSLSPRMTVERIVGEGLDVHFPKMGKKEKDARIDAVLEEVGLEPAMRWRYPHEFSGGQRQRIAIARAVVLEPRLILLDEPTSALDVSVQKQVLELLRRLQRDHAMSYLFITHDLKVIRAMAHRILVMHNGVVVEAGETAALFEAPRHDYTRSLLQASLFTDYSAAAS